MYYSEAERAREEWRHQQCAKYLRSQMDSAPSPYGLPPDPYARDPRPLAPALPYDSVPALPSDQALSLPVGGPCCTPDRTHENQCGWKVFEHFDTNRDYKIDKEEWRKGIETCNVDLSAATVADLFDKAAPGAETIGSGEWGGFCRRYPMLIDCLYHRFVCLRNADADLAEAEEARGPMQAAMRRAEQEAEQADRDLQHEEDAAAKEKDALGRAEEARQGAEERYRAAVEDANARARERTDAHRVVQQQWPEIQRRQAELYQAQRDCDIARRKIDDAADKERVLEQALREAREERERAEQAFSDGESRVRELSQKDGPDAEEEFRKADAGLGEAQKAESDAAAAMAEAQQMADRQKYREDDARRRRDGAKRASESATQALEAARKAQDANEDKLTAANATRANGPGKNAEGQFTEDADKENKLVVEEIRLREQRDALEKRENVLKEEHNTFTTPRKQSPVRERASPASPPGASSLGYTSSPAAAYATPGRY